MDEAVREEEWHLGRGSGVKSLVWEIWWLERSPGAEPQSRELKWLSDFFCLMREIRWMEGGLKEKPPNWKAFGSYGNVCSILHAYNRVYLCIQYQVTSFMSKSRKLHSLQFFLCSKLKPIYNLTRIANHVLMQKNLSCQAVALYFQFKFTIRIFPLNQDL